MKNGIKDHELARRYYGRIRAHVNDARFRKDVKEFVEIVEKNQNSPPGDGSFNSASWQQAHRIADILNRFLVITTGTQVDGNEERSSSSGFNRERRR
jgi:uncharacterized protein YaaR (DUF327 family)